MGLDDDADCVEHVWKLVGLTLADGAYTEYECVRAGCTAVLVRTPGQPFPGTV